MNTEAARKWSEMRGLAVRVPREGRVVGVVEDYFLKEGTNAIYSLRVRTRLMGDFSLPVIALKTIEADKVTIDNENMLIKALPPLPQIQDLLGRKVVDEEGRVLGTVGDAWLNVAYPAALHVTAYELAATKRGGRAKLFTSDSVVVYEHDVIMIQDQVAKRLR